MTSRDGCCRANDNEERSLHAQEVNLFPESTVNPLRLCRHSCLPTTSTISVLFSSASGGNFGLRWYGLAYVAAFFFGILIVRRLSRLGYCDIPAEKVSDFIIGGAIFGVLLGGRLGYMLFYDLENFLQNPLIFFRVMDGGMSAHGGILGLTLYTLWYSFRHQVSWRNIGDNLVVAAPIGLCLGRLANFINGELYGRVSRCLGRCSFRRSSTMRPRNGCVSVLMQAAAINPNWTTVENVVENVRHSPALRDATRRRALAAPSFAIL